MPEDEVLVPADVGVNELKEVIKFVIALGNGIGKSLEDGKWGLDDIHNFMPAISALVPAITGLGLIGDELEDLTDEEVYELKDYIKNEFDIPQEELEDTIESAFDLAVELFDFVKVFFMKSE